MLDILADRLRLRICFAFALLTALGGLVLASGTDNEAIPVIAVFFSIFGFLFVDWLRLFALPTIAAYAAMAVAAFYCISDFIDLDAPGNHQINAVAQLLVSVQAIMMMQQKTRKILEQLGVFCLLELVVSAIFNEAISYGMLMLPIGVVGAWGLTLLVAVSATEQMSRVSVLEDAEEENDSLSRKAKERKPDRPIIESHAASSTRSLLTSGIRIPKITLSTIGPSIALVGVIFFYAIPRTTTAHQGANRSNAVVGFSDELRLEQLGKMAQSNQIAARIKLRHAKTTESYVPQGEIYLRGAVLERYTWEMRRGSAFAKWNATLGSEIQTSAVLPMEYFQDQDSESTFADPVEVEIVCEASRSRSLFALPPYHRTGKTHGVAHQARRWCLLHLHKQTWVYPRKRYFFGTHGFQNKIQRSIIADSLDWGSSPMQDAMSASNENENPRRRDDDERRRERYRELLLQFDPDSMGTIQSIADSIAEQSRGTPVNDLEMAQSMAGHFAKDGRYRYTLNLDSDPIPGMDPIEQFVAADRKGHCQYFASALVMMLRSQGIPARMIAGFRTDEFNDLSNHFIARQSHAHAWVEALIDADRMPAPRFEDHPPANAYWVRLDPTPSALLNRLEATSVDHLLDSAQIAWDDYVVEMDSKKQENALGGASGDGTIGGSYSRFVERLSNTLAQIRAGRLGQGALASSDFFSWPAMGIFLALSTILLAFLKWGRPRWHRRTPSEVTSQQIPRPSIAFYDQTLIELERLGIERAANQTPEDLLLWVSKSFTIETADESSSQPTNFTLAQPLEYLTETFYKRRFGRDHGDPRHPSDETTIKKTLQDLQRCVNQMTQAKETHCSSVNQNTLNLERHRLDRHD